MTRRVMQRRVASCDRGFSMFEVLISMFMAALAITTVALISVSTTKNQRASRAYDVATQAANGMVEVARSLQWKAVGFASSQAGYQGTYTDDTNVTRNTVSTSVGLSALTPLSNVTVKGVPCTAGTTGCLTVRTDIGWITQPSAANAAVPVLGKMQIRTTVTTVDLVASVVTTVIRSETPVEAFATTPPPTLSVAPAGGGYQSRLTWTAPGSRSILQLQRAATADFASPVTIASPDLAADHGLFYDQSPIPGAYNYYRVHTTVAAGGVSDSPTVQIYAPPALRLPTMPGSGKLTRATVTNPDTTSLVLQQGTVADGFANPVETNLAANATSAPVDFAFNDTRVYRLQIGVGDGSTTYSNTVTSAPIPVPVLTLGNVDDVAAAADVKWNIPVSKFGVPRAGLVMGAVGTAVPQDVQSTTATTGTVTLPDPSAASGRNVDTPITLVLEAADGTILGQSNTVQANFKPVIPFAADGRTQALATPDNLNVAMALNWATTGQDLGATAVTLERSDNAGFVGDSVSLPVDLTSSTTLDNTAARGTPYWYRLTFTGIDPSDVVPFVVGPVSIANIPAIKAAQRLGTSTASVTWDPAEVAAFVGSAGGTVGGQVWMDSSTSADFSDGVTSTQITDPAQGSFTTPAYAPGNAYAQLRFIKDTTEVDTAGAVWTAPVVPTARLVDSFALLNQATYEMDQSPAVYGWIGAKVVGTFTGAPGSVAAGQTSVQTVTLGANSKSFTFQTPSWPSDLSYTIAATGPGGPNDTWDPATDPESYRSDSTCTADGGAAAPYSCALSMAPRTNQTDPTDTWDGNPPPFPGTAGEDYWNSSSYALRGEFTTAAPASVPGTAILFISPLTGTVQICARVTASDGVTTTRPCTDLAIGQTAGTTTAAVTSLAMQTDGNLVARGAGGVVVWSSQTQNAPVGLGQIYQLTWEADDSDIAAGGILRIYRSAVAGINQTLIWDSQQGRTYT